MKWALVIKIQALIFSLFGLAALCGLGLRSDSATAAPAVAPVAIAKIDVVGNKRIEKDAILEKMSLKVGAQTLAEAVRKDTLAIFEMGFFEDVRLELDGTTLVVVVKERPIVSEILYRGAEEFEKKDLDEVVGVKAFTVVNLAKIRSAQLAIAKKYEEKGYYLARADYALEPVPEHPSEVKLVFKVTENEKVRVRKVYFSGNQNFTSGDLKQVLYTSEGHAFSWATGGGTYREEAFERDLSVLAFYYGNEGYIQAKFAKPRVSLSQDRRYIDIFIDVVEGDRFNLGNVKFQGQDLMFSEEELAKSFEMKTGDVFSAGKLQEQVLKLTDKYGDEGYAFANVIPKPEIRNGEKIVDLTIDIERGEKVYWGKITITGNSKTHDKVIRRELQFAEGELYNATKRKKGLARIQRLGFFGTDINFITSTPKGTTNVLDLEIRIQEKPTGSLNVSAGFGTTSKFTLTGQISQNNLFGLGQQLAFDMQYSAITKSLNLGWTDPKIFDSEWLLGFDAYYSEDTVGGADRKDASRTYDQTRVGGSVRTGREIREDLSLFGTYKLARNELKNPISPLIFRSKDDEDSIISSVTSTLAFDTRNNRIDPSGGEYFTASSEFAGLGGRTFQKYSVAARVYRKVFWKVVSRTNLEYGLVANAFSTEPVPVYELYSLGGIFNLRGYDYSSIGPAIDNLVPTREDAKAKGVPPKIGYVIGGNSKVIFNQEIEFPLIPEADIRTVVFFDAGNAWDTTASADARSKGPSLFANYGWGIRWYSPLGPLRFEWGFPLTTRADNPLRKSKFWFIIAPTF